MEKACKEGRKAKLQKRKCPNDRIGSLVSEYEYDSVIYLLEAPQGVSLLFSSDEDDGSYLISPSSSRILVVRITLVADDVINVF